MAEKEEEKKEEMKSQEEELEEYFAEKTEDGNPMTKEDVIAIVRDELKTFWKGVMAGKYPLPKYPYAKKSLKIVEGEEEELQEEGIIIPITIKPVIAEEKSIKTDEDEKKEDDEQKDKEGEKEEDNTIDEQKTQITELQKTIADMKKELEDLKAEPEKVDDSEKGIKKEPYRSDILVENGRITKQ